MDLDDVAAELRTALQTITGLNVPQWGTERIASPAAVIGLPERIDYDGTYQRGSDRYPDLPVIVLLARPKDPITRRAIAPYTAGAGPASVKQAIEAYPYTSCDVVAVDWAEFEDVTHAGVDYLAAIFHLSITGQGASLMDASPSA